MALESESKYQMSLSVSWPSGFSSQWGGQLALMLGLSFNRAWYCPRWGYRSADNLEDRGGEAFRGLLVRVMIQDDAAALSCLPKSENSGEGWKNSRIGQWEGRSCQAWAWAQLRGKRWKIQCFWTCQCKRVCACVCRVHTLPSAGNPPRVWVQLQEPPCSSRELSHASRPQGQTSYSR